MLVQVVWQLLMQKDTLQTMNSDNEKDLFREAVRNVKPLKIKSKTIDTSNLSSGIYFMVIEFRGKYSVLKTIKL